MLQNTPVLHPCQVPSILRHPNTKNHHFEGPRGITASEQVPPRPRNTEATGRVLGSSSGLPAASRHRDKGNIRLLHRIRAPFDVAHHTHTHSYIHTHKSHNIKLNTGVKPLISDTSSAAFE